LRPILRVFEDKIEQEVVNFSSEDVPASIGVILDLSGSMADKLGRAKEAALHSSGLLIHRTSSLSSVSTIAVQLLSPVTDNVEDLQAGMLTMSAKGATLCSMRSIWGSINMKDHITLDGLC